MIHDLRHAVRLLLRSKGWTAIVVLSLALGIGANTAIFTAINGLLLRTIPVDHPETLVRFRYQGDNEMANNFGSYGYTENFNGRKTEESFSYPMYERLRAANSTLVDLFACAPRGQVNVIVNGQAELATSFIASGTYFDVLGVRAEIGRTFTPDDDRPGAPPVVVISHGYWVRRFGGSRDAVGTVLQIATARVTVVGVTPAAFPGVQQVVREASDITMPLALDPQFFGGAPPPPAPPRLAQATTWWLQIMGRLKPGATPEQVQGNLAGTFEGAAREGWASYFASL